MYHLASSVHKNEKCKLKSDYSVTDFENTFFFLMPIMEGAAERSYPTSEVRGSVGEEQPHVQGKEQHLCFAGPAVKRYPMSKVRDIQVRWWVLREPS